MAPKMDRTITKRKISQTIDLQSEFGIDFTGKKALKEKIGQLLIDRILDRTASGKSVTGKALKKPYSKSYKDSKEYEKYGKTGTINMELKGTMLDNIDIKNVTANTIDLAITERTQRLKAFNHITGDTLPKRDFFGVTKKDITAVKKEIRDELKGLKETDESGLGQAALATLATKNGNAALASLIDKLVEVEG